MMTSLPLQNKLSILFLNFVLFSALTISGNSSFSFNQKQFEEWSIQSSVPTALFNSNISEKCIQHSREYLAALHNRLPWAVKSRLLFRTLMLIFLLLYRIFH